MSSHRAATREQYTPSRGGSVLSHNGRTWYYRVVRKTESVLSLSSSSSHDASEQESQQAKNGRALLDDYSIDSMGPLSLVVCMMDPTGRRLYTVFRTVAEYFTFTHSLSEDHKSTRCFFEICFNERPQRLRFDIDIVAGALDESERILGDFVQAAQKAFTDLRCPIGSLAEDMVVCTSHGPTKMSYHVVFTHAFVRRSEEAKAFYLLVVRHMKPEYQVYVDVAVYSKTQQFRLLGFSKVGANRPKVCPEVWRYRRILSSACDSSDEHHEEKDQVVEEVVEVDTRPIRSRLNAFDVLRRTLISFADTGYPISVPCHTYSSISQGVICSGGTPNEVATRILSFARERFEALEHAFPFEFVGSSEDSCLILLRRTGASFCPTCSRAHEHENPFLRATWRGENRFDVMFDCRRAQSRQHLVGSLELPALRKIAIAAALQESVDPNDSEQGEATMHKSNSIAAWRRRTIEQALEHKHEPKKPSPNKPSKRAASEKLKFVSAHPSIVELLHNHKARHETSLQSNSVNDTATPIADESQQVFIVSEDMDVGDVSDKAGDAAQHTATASASEQLATSSSVVARGAGDDDQAAWKSSEEHNRVLQRLIGRVSLVEQKKLESKILKLSALRSSDPETRYSASSSTSLTAFWKLSSN